MKGDLITCTGSHCTGERYERNYICIIFFLPRTSSSAHAYVSIYKLESVYMCVCMCAYINYWFLLGSAVWCLENSLRYPRVTVVCVCTTDKFLHVLRTSPACAICETNYICSFTSFHRIKTICFRINVDIHVCMCVKVRVCVIRYRLLKKKTFSQ